MAIGPPLMNGAHFGRLWTLYGSERLRLQKAAGGRGVRRAVYRAAGEHQRHSDFQAAWYGEIGAILAPKSCSGQSVEKSTLAAELVDVTVHASSVQT
jgi:hypothetical protein